MLDTQEITKWFHIAVYRDYRGTAMDVVATTLLMGTLPKHFQRAIARLPTAHQAFNYLMETFTGGKNQEANLVW